MGAAPENGQRPMAGAVKEQPEPGGEGRPPSHCPICHEQDIGAPTIEVRVHATAQYTEAALHCMECDRFGPSRALMPVPEPNRVGFAWQGVIIDGDAAKKRQQRQAETYRQATGN